MSSWLLILDGQTQSGIGNFRGGELSLSGYWL